MVDSSTRRRSTKQRDLIYDIVRQLRSHPTAEDIYTIARHTLQQISLGTVYRNLRILTDEGRIAEIQFEPGKTRYDGVTVDHEHFICNHCGTVIDIEPTPAIRHAPLTHPQLRDKSVSNYSLTYYGLCETCRQQ